MLREVMLRPLNRSMKRLRSVQARRPITQTWAQCCMLKANSTKRRRLLNGSQIQPAEAMLCFERALPLNPDLVEAFSNLGLALESQGNVDAAVAAYKRALPRSRITAKRFLTSETRCKRKANRTRVSLVINQLWLLNPHDARTHHSPGLRVLLLRLGRRRVAGAQTCARVAAGLCRSPFQRVFGATLAKGLCPRLS